MESKWEEKFKEWFKQNLGSPDEPEGNEVLFKSLVIIMRSRLAEERKRAERRGYKEAVADIKALGLLAVERSLKSHGK